MMRDYRADDFSEKQLEILEKLLVTPYMQKDLAEELGISGAGLLYHIRKLEKKNLIGRETTVKVGSVSRKEISLNANVVQAVRRILNKSTGEYTLITGMGKDSPLGDSHQLPALTKDLLVEEGYAITRTFVFATPESSLDKGRQLTEIDEVLIRPYHDYRNDQSELMRDFENTLQKELKKADLILDLTPLSKYLTIKLLDFSYQYQVPACYLAKRGEKDADENYLLWINLPKNSIK